MFGISGSEFIVLLAVAAVVLGPERLPQYAQQLGRLVRELRRMAQGATAQMRDEMGPEFDDIDWRKLDPRQYDPRRIVREALQDSFDPDDPLGLREADRADREDRGDRPGRPDGGEKPVNGGSHPMERQTAEKRAENGAARPTEPAPPPYDLDAT